MKKNKLKVDINRPIQAVFWFTVDPSKTPQWIKGMVKEEANEWPPKRGTLYKNVNRKGAATLYVCTRFEENRIFELREVGGSYHVRYTYERRGDVTRLIYFEWVDKGSIASPFGQGVLDRLKSVLEK